MIGDHIHERRGVAGQGVGHLVGEGRVDREQENDREKRQPASPAGAFQDQQIERQRDPARGLGRRIFPTGLQAFIGGDGEITRAGEGRESKRPVIPGNRTGPPQPTAKTDKAQPEENSGQQVQIQSLDQHDAEDLQVEKLVDRQQHRCHGANDHHDPTEAKVLRPHRSNALPHLGGEFGRGRGHARALAQNTTSKPPAVSAARRLGSQAASQSAGAAVFSSSQAAFSAAWRATSPSLWA